jgi:hypothetical protein
LDDTTNGKTGEERGYEIEERHMHLLGIWESDIASYCLASLFTSLYKENFFCHFLIYAYYYFSFSYHGFALAASAGLTVQVNWSSPVFPAASVDRYFRNGILSSIICCRVIV